MSPHFYHNLMSNVHIECILGSIFKESVVATPPVTVTPSLDVTSTNEDASNASFKSDCSSMHSGSSIDSSHSSTAIHQNEHDHSSSNTKKYNTTNNTRNNRNDKTDNKTNNNIQDTHCLAEERECAKELIVTTLCDLVSQEDCDHFSQHQNDDDEFWEPSHDWDNHDSTDLDPDLDPADNTISTTPDGLEPKREKGSWMLSTHSYKNAVEASSLFRLGRPISVVILKDTTGTPLPYMLIRSRSEGNRLGMALIENKQQKPTKKGVFSYQQFECNFGGKGVVGLTELSLKRIDVGVPALALPLLGRGGLPSLLSTATPMYTIISPSWLMYSKGKHVMYGDNS